MTFLGKALRASLSVLVLFVFFAPWFGTKLGAFMSILASLAATTIWFMAGNPFGIDNAYLALLVPLAVMGVSEIVKRARKTADGVPAEL
jgi:SSS family solute:Na+ symporter